jgi:hypothetical protein
MHVSIGQLVELSGGPMVGTRREGAALYVARQRCIVHRGLKTRKKTGEG